MSSFATTMPPAYFEALYRANADPWDFEHSAYERDKYAATVAALPARRYRHGLEVGCSIGVLTELLGRHCNRLTALDASTTALAAARARCRDAPHVAFVRMAVPDDFPDGRFDLIVLSEVLYYLDRGDLARLAERCLAALQPEGDIVLVHWTGETNYPLSGDEAAEHFLEAMRPTVQVVSCERHPRYRLDVARRGSHVPSGA